MNKRFSLIFGTLTLLILLSVISANAQTGPATTATWPMFHPGVTQATGPASNKLAWNYSTHGAMWSSPAIADGMLFTASFDHQVYALNAVTGDLVWNFTTGNPIDSSPAILP